MRGRRNHGTGFFKMRVGQNWLPRAPELPPAGLAEARGQGLSNHSFLRQEWTVLPNIGALSRTMNGAPQTIGTRFGDGMCRRVKSQSGVNASGPGYTQQARPATAALPALPPAHEFGIGLISGI